jgi:hypothetical protein
MSMMFAANCDFAEDQLWVRNAMAERADPGNS